MSDMILTQIPAQSMSEFHINIDSVYSRGGSSQ